MPAEKKTAQLGHAYIVSAPSRERALAEAKSLAKRALCSAGGKEACGVCRNCRKVEADIHPDLKYISRELNDKGKPKQFMTVNIIRDLAADAQILPNEAERRVFVLTEADYLNLQAQNAALKLLEEPPAWDVFILCVCRPETIITTIKSRCAELNFNCDTEAYDDSTVKLAKEYIGLAVSGNGLKLAEWCQNRESMKGPEFQSFLECCESILADEVCGRENSFPASEDRAMKLIELVEKCLKYLKVNVSVKHLLGLLMVCPAETVKKTNDRKRG